ncbi:unnamed protein product [Durusdinium trenchii]|uniref:Uncharacterized protein n=1 Tax=Durusdinium trenchii TaxID=1381693 RepID=A0ABP0J0P4_9DINO
MPSWAARSGQQLAGGFLGCLDGILGDQEWLFKVLQLKRSWHSFRRHVCHYCGAVRRLEGDEPETMLFTAYGPRAAHRNTLIKSKDDWIAVHGHSTLTAVPGFTPIRIPFAARAAKKLFTTAVIAPSATGYAHVSQKYLKGGAARMFVYWITEVCYAASMTDPSAHNKHRTNVFLALASIYTTLAEQGRYLTQEPITDIHYAYMTFRQSYNYLANEALNAEKFVWQLLPKQHMLEHLFLDWVPIFGNCRRYSLYLDEDMVGRAKRIVSHTHPRTMSVAGLNHFALAAALRWCGQDALLR